jgi:hypothetical protein
LTKQLGAKALSMVSLKITNIRTKKIQLPEYDLDELMTDLIPTKPDRSFENAKEDVSARVD